MHSQGTCVLQEHWKCKIIAGNFEQFLVQHFWKKYYLKKKLKHLTDDGTSRKSQA